MSAIELQAIQQPEIAVAFTMRETSMPTNIVFIRDRKILPYQERELEVDSENTYGSEGRGVSFPYEDVEKYS